MYLRFLGNNGVGRRRVGSDTEKLVNFVCNYEFLYNKDDKMYKNKPKVSAVWREIAKNLGISGV